MSRAAVHMWWINQATTFHGPAPNVNTNYLMLFHLSSTGGPYTSSQLELKKAFFWHLAGLISNFVAESVDYL